MLNAPSVPGSLSFTPVKKRSFFEFARQYCETPAMHRILTLMRMWGCEYMAIEELSTCREWKKDADCMKNLCGPSIAGITLKRLSFFRTKISTQSELNARGGESFLGAAMIAELRFKSKPIRKFIYEAGFRLPSQHCSDVRERKRSEVTVAEHREGCLGSYFIHSATNLIARIGPKWKTEFKGVFFCEAPYIGSRLVCIHAALRMILRNHGHRKTFASICEELAQVSGDPYQTLATDAHKYLKSLKLNVFQFDFMEQVQTVPLAQVLHSLVEPGYGTLLSFTTAPEEPSHVISVLGHTLNSHSWFPVAELGYGSTAVTYANTSRWADNFIVNDNNLGPILEMRQDVLTKITLPSYDPSMRVSSVIGIAPPRVKLSAVRAEQLALSVACTLTSRRREMGVSYKWFRALHKALLRVRRKLGFRVKCRGRSAEAALRSVLIKKGEYLAHLHSMKDRRGRGISCAQYEEIAAFLPAGTYWMIEFTEPDIFIGNGGKYGEFLFPAEKNIASLDPSDYGRYRHMFRAPGVVFLSDSNTPGSYRWGRTRIESYVRLYVPSTTKE